MPLRNLTGGKGIFKYYAPVMNPHGNGYVVYLFEPSMMEHVLRNEGKYPCRGPAFEFLGVLRYVHSSVKTKLTSAEALGVIFGRSFGQNPSAENSRSSVLTEDSDDRSFV